MMLGQLKGFSKILIFIMLIIGASNIEAQITSNVFADASGIGFQKKTNFRISTSGEQVPVIATSKKSFIPNETVFVEGNDFEAYERVLISVSQVNKYSENVLVKHWDTYADGKGYLLTSWDLENAVADASDFEVVAEGTNTGKSTKTWFSTTKLVGENISQLTQCANGPGLPQGQNCPEVGSTGWVSGNVGASKSQYIEGDSISYRVILDNLDIGDVYEYRFGWDVTKGGLNAIDYLTTYNRSITNANPCKGTTESQVNFHCTQSSPTSVVPIPIDSMVTSGLNRIDEGGGGDDISQIPGVLTMWGGQMDETSAGCFASVGKACGLSSYNYTNPSTFPAGDESASITVTFRATNTKMVLAWGGHIATRTDWGRPNGSVNITGSPYHMFNMSGNNLTEGTTNIFSGNREVQLSTASIIVVGRIIIYEHASPTTSANFNYSGNFSTKHYTASNIIPLQDMTTDLGHSHGGTNPSVPTNNGDDPSWVISDITDFTNTLTVSKTLAPGYVASGIDCSVTEDFGTANDSLFPSGNSAGSGITSMGIRLGSGDEVTCTFFSSAPTAAGVSMDGRVITQTGRTISNALVTITDSDGSSRLTRTNMFGNFRFTDIEAGSSVVIQVNHKNYIFSPQVVTLNDDLSNFEIIAN